jgi:glutaredoxin/glutathione-dependent peroxiredoxin
MINAEPSLVAAQGLSGRKVASFLRERGWTAQASKIDGISIFSKDVLDADGTVDLVLPVKPGFVDELQRVADALRVVAQIEGQSEAQIADEIRSTLSDKMSTLRSRIAEFSHGEYARAAIKVGDRVPYGSFVVMTAEGPKPKTTDELFKGKKVVLFAVPGAFTPTAHKNHLPSFVKNAAAIKGKGVDTIAVTGVNDVFVMDAWKKASGGDAIEFLADGSGNWAKALGLTADLTERGLGVRSQRYAMVVEDGVVKTLHIEDSPGKAEISGVENLLKAM